MDYRISFALVFISAIVSPVLSASTTSNYENATDIITTGSSTIVPINNETSTLPPNENGTTKAPPAENGTTVTHPAEVSTVSVGPATTYTGSTETPSETTSSKPATVTTTVRPTPAKTSSGFDGGSFAGGIALGAVLVLIMFGVFCYCRRHKGSGSLLPSVEY